MFYFVRISEILNINIGITSQNIQGLVSNGIDIRSDINYTKDVLQILEENFNR